MKRTSIWLVAALMALSGVFSPLAISEESPSTEKAAVVSESGVKAELKKKRGQLLSKRNKIRRLEKAAVASDAALREKIDVLQKQREALFCSANSQLSVLYAEEKAMQAEIDALSAKK